MQRMAGTSKMPYPTWLVGILFLKFLSMESTWEALTVCSVLIHRSFTAMISKNSLSIWTHTYWFFYGKNADSVHAYESRKLAKLLNIAVKDDL
jgi:hypothetical protein